MKSGAVHSSVSSALAATVNKGRWRNTKHSTGFITGAVTVRQPRSDALCVRSQATAVRQTLSDASCVMLHGVRQPSSDAPCVRPVFLVYFNDCYGGHY